MKNWTPDEMYQDGATFAEEVQALLKAGRSFDENGHIRLDDGGVATTPENAAHIRDIYREHNDEYVPWWDGYVSRWD